MILLLLIVIQIVRGEEILFNCTFNEGFNNECAFHSRISSMIETLHIVDHQQTMINTTNPPNRPISDATSVCKKILVEINVTIDFLEYKFSFIDDRR